MSHFYGEIYGDRGSSSKCGSKKGGLRAHLRGWDIGVNVRLVHIDGIDVIEVYRTGGSNGHSPEKHLITIKENDG